MKIRHSTLLCLLMFAVPPLLCADATSDAGAKTYGAKCSTCHAKNGKGNPAMAKVFKVEPTALDMTKKATLDKSDADLAKIVKEGLNKMPSYKGKLTDADIASVVAYIRFLAKPVEHAK